MSIFIGSMDVEKIEPIPGFEHLVLATGFFNPEVRTSQARLARKEVWTGIIKACIEFALVNRREAPIAVYLTELAVWRISREELVEVLHYESSLSEETSKILAPLLLVADITGR